MIWDVEFGKVKEVKTVPQLVASKQNSNWH